MAQSYSRSEGTQSWEESDLAAVEAAVLHAVAYSDIFDYPLTGPEIHRYLVGVRASWRETQGALADMTLRGQLARRSGYYLMQGRDGIVETRQRRAEVAASMWPRAKRYGEAISKLPFVRMVAVTGALAMDNVDPGTDIDYLIVTEPGRLWICRALVVGLVKLAARQGNVICPNFFLSERALDLGEPNLFTAHELVQTVPLAGMETYRRMCEINSWAAWFLPNAFDAPRPVPPGGDEANPKLALDACGGVATITRPFPWNAAEALLRMRAGTALEGWEMRRKVWKLNQQSMEIVGAYGPAPEINLSPERCKGHFDNHRQTTLEAYSLRLQRLAVGFPKVAEMGDAM